MPTTRSPSHRLLVGLALLAPQLVIVLAAARLWAANNNTLARNGRWVATGEGAQAFLHSSRTLAGEELALGLAGGPRELFFREPLALREVSFDFRLVPGTWLELVFDAGGQRRGVRVSSDPAAPSALLTTSAIGESLASEPLAVPAVPIGHHARMVVGFEPEAFTVTLERTPLGRFVAERPERSTLGFRCGAKPIQVDDVRIRTADGALLHESFEHRRGRWRAASLGLIAVVAANGLCLAVLRRRSAR